MAHGECNHSTRGKLRPAETAFLVATLLFIFAVSSDARIVHGFSDVFAIDTVTAADEGDHVPEATALTAIYPNPFNPRTTSEYKVADDAMLDSAVDGLQGRLGTVVDEGRRSSGTHHAAWGGCKDAGQEMPGGLYFWRVVAGDNVHSVKMMLTK